MGGQTNIYYGDAMKDKFFLTNLLNPDDFFVSKIFVPSPT